MSEEMNKLKLYIDRILEDTIKPTMRFKTKNEEHIKNAKKIESQPLLDCHKEVLRDYYDTLRLHRKRVFTTDKNIKNNGVIIAKSFRSYAHYLLVLSKFAKFLQKPFDKAVERDILNYQVYLDNKGISERTIGDYSYIIKLFYIWHFRTEEIPELVVNIIKPKMRLPNIKSEEMLLPSDIKKLVQKADNSRDKAIVQMLFELGGRVGEMHNASIKDFQKKENYGILRLKGKTGERNMAFSDSLPALEKWINDHPHKDDPNAPLFICLGPNSYGNRLTVRGFQCTLLRLGKLANIKKKMNPHHFRHSSMDYLTRQYHFNERDLKFRGGWSKNSKMPQVYLHYEEDEVNERYLEHKGIKTEKTNPKEKVALKPVECPRCGKVNPAGSRYCNCGHIVDQRELLVVEGLKKEANEFTDNLMKAPLREDSDLSKGMLNAMYENLVKNPVMFKEFKQLMDKIQTEE